VLSHGKPLALVFTEIERLHGFGFRRVRVRRLDGAEMMGARSQDRDAPAAELGGSRLPFGDFIPLEIAAAGTDCES
jgi:hypothetical protein